MYFQIHEQMRFPLPPASFTEDHFNQIMSEYLLLIFEKGFWKGIFHVNQTSMCLDPHQN